MYVRAVGLLLVSTAFAALAGCSGNDAAAGGANQAPLTLSEGHRYLVRIDGDQVVLKRHVDGHPLPFDDAAFVGKNLVIHPSDASGDDGLFARVESESVDGDLLTLHVRPLGIDEIAKASLDGDDTLTLYKNAKLAALPTILPNAAGVHEPVEAGAAGSYGVGTQSFTEGALRLMSDSTEPQSGTTVEWPPTIGGMIGFTGALSGGASVKFRDTDFSFVPGLSGRWIEDRGLELGADLDLKVRFTMDIDALALASKPVIEKVAEKDLLTLTKAGPVTLFEAPVLLGGVYTTVGVKGSLGCYGRVEQHFKGSVVVDIEAKVAGSVVFEVSPSSSSDKWITEGNTPFDASGHADVHFDADDVSTNPSLYCELPRLTVYVQPGGKLLDTLGGPRAYVAAVGKYYTSWEDEGGFKVQGVAGITAKPLGKTVTAEMPLVTWRP